MLLFLSPFSAQPQAMDQAVQSIALSLRNQIADPVMVAISQLSRWPVPVFSAAALLMWLLGARRYSAAVHWLVAIIGGGLIHLLLSWSLRNTPQVFELSSQAIRGPSAAMNLITVVLAFFAVMEAGELKRRARQWPYIAAALLLTLLTLARIYLGMEWLSGALVGILFGLAWTTVVGIAYRQRAKRRFSGSIASLIFYGCFLALFVWQVREHNPPDLLALQTAVATRNMDEGSWWDDDWRQLPMERSRQLSQASTRFNAQIAVEPARIAELLGRADWKPVPTADWRWILQALNPEPDPASLPLLSRAFQGRSEDLLLHKQLAADKRQLTVRLWDSGIRLMPGEQILYLAQLSEEKLIQRFGMFSYWRAVPLSAPQAESLRELMHELEQKLVQDELLLVRENR